MIHLSAYIRRFSIVFETAADPWQLTIDLASLIGEKLKHLGPEYAIEGDVAVHNSAKIHPTAMMSGPAIVSSHCFVGPHALLRGGVFLDERVSIGPGCEIKSSCIFADSAVAHFNFVGDSILGSFVNLEAGAVIANHYNERENRSITVRIDGQTYPTGVEKFGALIGDDCRIGANAVLSPGTILQKKSVVKRLELIDQNTGTG